MIRLSAFGFRLSQLREAGVLGVNARNRLISRWNQRKFYPRVDDKLLTKELARAAGVAVPELLGVVDAYGDLRRLDGRLRGLGEFAVKPVKGSKGNGVLIVAGREGDAFVCSDGRRVSARDLGYHVAGILAGLYSLGGQVDRAMIEERLRCDPAFERVATGGVPDVRVVVFRGVPVMAMARLPTRASRGRANLHQGAMAAGLDLATGRVVHAILHGKPADSHPDTGARVAGLAVPRWDELLEISARCADAAGLGYVGVDLVLDARHGPVLLELNARPGLGIQLANRRGLVGPLRAVEAANPTGMTPAQRARMGIELAATAVGRAA